MSFAQCMRPLRALDRRCAAALGARTLSAVTKEEAAAAPKGRGRGRTRKRSFERRHLRLDILKKYGLMAAEHEKRAAERGMGMELRAAAVVERTPVVMPELPEWKREFFGACS